MGNHSKSRNEALNQLIGLWKSNKVLGSNIQNFTLKVLQKLCIDPILDDKLREIINLGVRKFGGEF